MVVIRRNDGDVGHIPRQRAIGDAVVIQGERGAGRNIAQMRNILHQQAQAKVLFESQGRNTGGCIGAKNESAMRQGQDNV